MADADKGTGTKPEAAREAHLRSVGQMVYLISDLVDNSEEFRAAVWWRDMNTMHKILNASILPHLSKPVSGGDV